MLQAPGSLLQQSGVIDQQKQLYQSQRLLLETKSSKIGTMQFMVLLLFEIMSPNVLKKLGSYQLHWNI